jgi:hypothetical protein
VAKYNPKILVEFPFNYLYKVKQMKHNHFNPKKLHRISECEKKKNNNNNNNNNKNAKH